VQTIRWMKHRKISDDTQNQGCGPDNSGTGADGIEGGWTRQQRNVRLPGLGEREVLRKWAGICGYLGAVMCGSQTFGGGPDGTWINQRAGGQNGCTIFAVFEVKKEISAYPGRSTQVSTSKPTSSPPSRLVVFESTAKRREADKSASQGSHAKSGTANGASSQRRDRHACTQR